MKWISHSAIGGTSAAIVEPMLAPVAILGATAPDWLEMVLNAAGVGVEHRKETHYLIVWAVLFFVALFVAPSIPGGAFIAAFMWGGLTHILTDALTVQGVPFSPTSRRRFHLFGGRLKTGSVQEYVIAFSLSAVFVVVGIQMHRGGAGSDFAPYFFDWSGAYEDGKIDAYEWKQNRWKFI